MIGVQVPSGDSGGADDTWRGVLRGTFSLPAIPYAACGAGVISARVSSAVFQCTEHAMATELKAGGAARRRRDSACKALTASMLSPPRARCGFYLTPPCLCEPAV
jgi:hypothetical protein